MKTYSGSGTLHFGDGKNVAGSFEVEIVGNGDMSARFSPAATHSYTLTDRLAQRANFLFVCDDGSSVDAQRAMVAAVGGYIRLKVPHIKVSGRPRNSGLSVFRYELANCVFRLGSHLTEFPNGGWSRNAIEINADAAALRIVKIDTYDEVVKELEARKEGGVTAILEVTGPTDQPSCDAWATAVCNLLCFATKNTVRWISREGYLGDNRSEIEYFSPAVYQIRTLRSLIPDMPTSGEHPLHVFLQLAVPRYSSLDDAFGLTSTIGWLLEAEFSMPIQPKFVLAFIAIERLRSRLLKGAEGPKALLSSDFGEKIDGALGAQLVAAIDAAVGPLEEDTKSVLVKKLKSLNQPTIAASLDALCEHFGIAAATKKIFQLRNRLTHAGDLGDFDFPEALDLYIELSHILDICILKALGYVGIYHHHGTGWQERRVP